MWGGGGIICPGGGIIIPGISGGGCIMPPISPGGGIIGGRIMFCGGGLGGCIFGGGTDGIRGFGGGSGMFVGGSCMRVKVTHHSFFVYSLCLHMTYTCSFFYGVQQYYNRGREATKKKMKKVIYEPVDEL